MPEPEVHNRAGDPLEVHNRANEPINLQDFAKKPAVIHELLNKPRQMPDRQGTITRRPDDFPPVQQVTQTTTEGGSTDINFSFQLEDASEPGVGGNPDNPIVLIHDGEVNGTVPTGMGADDFQLEGVYDGAFINLIITYDTSTLEITSLTFAVEADVADPTLGSFRIEIGRTYVDLDGGGHITSFTAVNTQLGDINFQLIYGSLNGQPAVIPVAIYSGFVSAL